MIEKLKTFLTVIALLGLASYSLPVVAIAASGSVQVGQPSETGVEPAPGSTGGGSGGSADNGVPVLSNVVVSVSYNSATITWNTNELALSRVVWGTSSEYSSGTVAGEQYVKKHTASISDLQPSTRYFFQLTNLDTSNNSSSYYGVFVTLTPPDTSAPTNPSRLVAVPRANVIELTWRNPSDPDLTSIRIVRSDKFFPLDPLNGEVIFEGLDTKFTDSNVKPGVIYYYSAFSRDRSGNFSSGAIAYTMIAGSEDGISIDPQTGAPVIDLELPFASNYNPIPKSFKDFILSYGDGIELDSLNMTVPVGENLKIIIPKSKLNDAGSFLTLTVKDPAMLMAESSYLFSYDQDNREFSVITPSFDTPKGYELIVTVFTSSKLIVERVNGKLQIVKSAQAGEGDGQESLLSKRTRYIVLGGMGVSAIVVTWHFARLARLRAQMEVQEKIELPKQD